MDLSITVTGKWYPEKRTKYGPIRPGWKCVSSNPEIETERFESYPDAFESYLNLLKDNWSSTWENYPQIIISDPVCKGKTESFKEGAGEFTLSLSEDEVSISWIIVLTKPVNRTLSEYEPVKSVFETALPELEKLGEEQGFTVSLHKGTDPAGEEA